MNKLLKFLSALSTPAIILSWFCIGAAGILLDVRYLFVGLAFSIVGIIGVGAERALFKSRRNEYVK